MIFELAACMQTQAASLMPSASSNEHETPNLKCLWCRHGETLRAQHDTANKINRHICLLILLHSHTRTNREN